MACPDTSPGSGPRPGWGRLSSALVLACAAGALVGFALDGTAPRRSLAESKGGGLLSESQLIRDLAAGGKEERKEAAKDRVSAIIPGVGGDHSTAEGHGKATNKLAASP
eukprot:CAMPEP_0206253618 /NCGR_PEP_ID=MMETSP0047_2-20121206/23250_1 /ASSEMBLY_ACC=CAM_ASM_000192 /TAXON_ID=195065 /ORGANISM="Chroomonas mesostigmatica_cf, Strain CCMP1168" /LENGTH=108 /DNA_ID=CAMNT_0053679843 /DNA_START=120 /DNA_END=442 /DNA_ORIENTATION=-